MDIQAAPAVQAVSEGTKGHRIIGRQSLKVMNAEKTNQYLGIGIKAIALLGVALFTPAAINELNWLYRGKKQACAKIKTDYEALVVSSGGLNTRAFNPGDGTAINQAFLGTVLASSTQSPNAKLLQAAIYGCGTSSYPLQQTTW